MLIFDKKQTIWLDNRAFSMYNATCNEKQSEELMEIAIAIVGGFTLATLLVAFFFAVDENVEKTVFTLILAICLVIALFVLALVK